MKTTKNTNRTAKYASFLEWGTLLVIVVVINVLANVFYKRIDLTAENRYTLSETSLKLCSKLNEKLYFKLYLDGEMSPRFRQLRDEIRDLAYEFREASGKNIEIEIVDPFADKTGSEISAIIEDFAGKGMFAVRDIEDESGDQLTIKQLVPAAELNYAGKSVAVNFYQLDVALDPAENIQKAIDNLEYEIANGLRQCTLDKPKNIVFADGSGEMTDDRIKAFALELSKYYNISKLNLNVNDPESARPFLDVIQKTNPDSLGLVLLEKLQRRLNGNDLLVVCKPEIDYSLPELYLIDQFLMKGGKILWMIDPIAAEIDSFESNSQIIAMSRELENIEASLFKYGIKLENTVLADALSNAIPIPVGGRPELIDFQYFPVFTSAGLTHPITKNLGLVWSQFASTINIKAADNLQVVPLLTSSPNTKIITPPARIDLQAVYMQSKDDNYKNTLRGGTQLSGALIEGEFLSPFLYQRKFTELPFINRGKSKMIILADGDIARNATSKKGMIFPTGYDRFTRNTFANKTFLLNCIDYLIDDNGLIEIRAKEKVVRLLDKEKIRQEKTFYQWLNMSVPLLTVLLFGLINGWIRRRKYAKV